MGASTGIQIRPLGGIVQALSQYGANLFKPPGDTIRNIDQSGWYSPLQPVEPMGPKDIEPRAFQYWWGQNLTWTPRFDAEYSAAQLRALSQYPLARVCIQNVTDSLIKANWEIQPKPAPGEPRKSAAKRGIGDENLLKLNKFFERPDREHVWPDWLKPFLEDMLVIDAACLLIRKTFNGQVVEIPSIRGELIVRYVDENGLTPMPPQPAYAQNWWGIPLCFHEDTEVLTSDGWKLFQDVSLETDQIATREPNTKRFEWQAATARQEFDYDGELIRFDSKSIDVAVTPDHRMIVERLPYALGGGGQRWKGKIGESVITALQLEQHGTGATGIPVTSKWKGILVGPKRFPSFQEDVHIARLATDEHWREMNQGGISGSMIARAEGASVTAVCRALRLERKRMPKDARVMEMTGDDYCALLGIYLAEGSCDGNFINVAQSESNPRRAEIEKLLTRINGGRVPAYSTGAYKFSAKYLARHLRRLGHAIDKFIPSEIMNATPEQLRIFWHNFWLGDGDSSRSRAFTSSKRMADQLQELAQKMGTYATIKAVKLADRVVKDRDGNPRVILAANSKPHYTIAIRTRQEGGYTYRYKKTREKYAGKVQCLTVPNGTLYVRRNGKPCWVGNCNLTTEQCIYRPRNIVPGNTVSSMLYGTSPTQQAAPWIEIGIERLAFQLAYYKEGSIPGVVQVVPRGTSPDKIAEAMTWMNSELAGNLAARRQWRMVQGFNEPGKDDQILLTKEPLLTDAFDEDHINKICFSYGTSPQRLKKMMNRASAQASEESSDVEGMLPYFAWLKNSVIDHLIQRVMGYEDYEMVFNPVAEPNPEKKQVILSGYVHEGILRRNEARAQLGEEPVTDQPEADQLCVTTGSGAVPLGAPVVGTQPGEASPEGSIGGKPGAKPPAHVQGNEDDEVPVPVKGKSNGSGKPNGKGLHAHTENRPIGFAAGTVIAEPQSLRHGLIEPANGLNKRQLKAKGTLAINPGKLFPQSILGKHSLERVLTKRFRGMQRKSVKVIAAAMNLPHHHLAKADDQDAVLNQILESLANDWQAIADSALDALPDAAQAGADNGGIQLDITDEGMLGDINEVARDWAEDRAAELVGMRRLEDGSLITNPNAKWAISDTTRDKLRDIITEVFETEDEIAPGEHVTLRDIESRIEQSGIFSDVRASLIARNEIARAQTKGNLFSWQESGLVKSVDVVLSADHDVDDECNEAADGGPYPIREAPYIPLHINCICSLVLSELEDGVE